MESFDSLLSKSIKTGKEFRFYVGAVLILSAAFSFLFFWHVIRLLRNCCSGKMV